MCNTPMLQEAVKNDPSQLEKVQAWTPLQRLSEASESAMAIAFLCMRASGYITGHTLPVDGGLLAQGFAGPCVPPPTTTAS